MRIKKLDGLRGVFCVMLFFYHYSHHLIPESFYQFFMVANAYTFVDYFFILSGFVITMNYSTIDGVKSCLLYIKKRLKRIYPLLLLTTLLMFGFLASLEFVFRGPILFNKGGLEPALITLVNKLKDTLLLTSSTPIFGCSMGINQPSWSISAEMICYLVFGILSLISDTKLRPWLSGLMVIICSVFLFKTSDVFATGDFGFVRGLLGFNLGVIVFYFYSKLKHSEFVSSKNRFSLFEFLSAFFALVLLYFFSEVKQSNHPKVIALYSLVMIFSFALLLLVFLKTKGFISTLMEHSYFQKLGKWSYSIYLNHILVISLFSKVVFRFTGLPGTPIFQYGILLVTFIILLIYSSLTYRLVEWRFMDN